MNIDRADWHYGGDFPKDLPRENGATHIGMFVGWAIRRGLVGELHRELDPEAVEAVADGRMSGRAFLLDLCDEKFTNEVLDDEGNRFAGAYYAKGYFEDYAECVGADLPTLYHVADSPENRAKVEAMLDRRFDQWRRGRLGSSR
ncbi:MAG: hypothetical protein R3F34_20480 [Planctomycetota bacterium]